MKYIYKQLLELENRLDQMDKNFDVTVRFVEIDGFNCFFCDYS